MKTIKCDCQGSEHDEACETQCAYCGAMIPTNFAELVPAASDDEEWSQLAELHGNGCEWIETRAHRRDY